MKNLFIICLLSISANQLFAQSNRANATLENVTVFTNGAELNHSAKFQLSAGNNEIIIGNLSNQMDENSIQLGCNADVTIMSVSFRQEYLSAKNLSPDYVKCKDSLKSENEKLLSINSQIGIYSYALTLLDENKKVSGKNTGLNVAELMKAVDYYISKNKEIKSILSNLTNQQEKQQEIVTKLQSQLNELSNSNKNSKGELVVQLQSDKSTAATFGLSYITNNANWTPVYDLKINSTNSPLKLIYKGSITQWCGLDWKKAKLSLSTSNPTQNSTAPLLSTWFLNYYQPSYAGKEKMNIYQNRMQSYGEQAKTLEQAPIAVGGARPAGVDDYTTVTENAVNATFDIDLLYDIPSDSKANSVSMKEYELPATYKHYTAPRIDKEVFLMAELTDWEKLNLLAGPANIIFDGTFIGKSMIDPNATTDTLNLSLGRDKKIIVKREKLTEFSSCKTIGSNKTHLVTYEIRVRNTRKEKINLLLKDQFPKSTSDDIKIELLESSSAMINEDTNIMTWKLDIAPGETKKVKVSFTVKVPKDKQLGNLF